MSILDDINEGIASLSKRREEQSARNAVLQEQIDRLEVAKSWVDECYSNAQALSEDVKRYDPSEFWQGNKYHYYYDKRLPAYSKSKTLVDDVNANYNAICDKITQLENEKIDGWRIISGCSTEINNLQNAWNKAWHSMFG